MKVRLTLTVDYEKDDGSLPEEGECHGLLEELARLAANRGLLTGEAPGLLAGSWDYDVKTVAPVQKSCSCSGGFNLNAAVGGNVTCLTCGKPYGGRPEPELGQGKAYTGSLNDQRQDECEHIYQNGHPDFDWFDQPPVEDANGWETAQPGDEYWRTVFVRDAENPDGPTIAMVLRITFQPRTADVKQITFGRK